MLFGELLDRVVICLQVKPPRICARSRYPRSARDLFRMNRGGSAALLYSLGGFRGWVVCEFLMKQSVLVSLWG